MGAEVYAVRSFNSSLDFVVNGGPNGFINNNFIGCILTWVKYLGFIENNTTKEFESNLRVIKDFSDLGKGGVFVLDVIRHIQTWTFPSNFKAVKTCASLATSLKATQNFGVRWESKTLDSLVLFSSSVCILDQVIRIRALELIPAVIALYSGSFDLKSIEVILIAGTSTCILIFKIVAVAKIIFKIIIVKTNKPQYCKGLATIVHSITKQAQKYLNYAFSGQNALGSLYTGTVLNLCGLGKHIIKKGF